MNEDIIEILRWWIRPRLRSFPRWDFDEILSEAYLAAASLLPKWDPDKGNLKTYLKPRLYDYVRRRYLKANGYIEGRWADGVQGTRNVRKLEMVFSDLKDVVDVPAPEDIEDDGLDWSQVSDKVAEVLILMSKGYTMQQINDMHGHGQSTINNRLKRFRSTYKKPN